MSSKFDYKFNSSLQKELPCREIILDDTIKNATIVLFDNKDQMYIQVLGFRVDDLALGKTQKIQWTKTSNKAEASLFSADAARIVQQVLDCSDTISHLQA